MSFPKTPDLTMLLAALLFGCSLLSLSSDGVISGSLLESSGDSQVFSPGPVILPEAQNDSLQPDRSGLGLFWSLTDTLATGTMPSDAAWNRLLGHPGYKLLGDIAQRHDELRTCIPAVFNPAQQATLDSLLADGTRLERRICAHLDRVRQMRSTLETYADTVDARAIVEHGVKEARVWLPEELPDADLPAIYFTLHEPVNFAHDGVITYDLLTFMERSRLENILTIGHEMHHAYSSPIRQIQLDDRMPGYEVLSLFRRLQSEGVASMIDKQRYIGADPDSLDTSFDASVVEGMNVGYQKSPRALRRIDSLLATTDTDSASLRQAGNAMYDLLAEVNYQPHIPGLYMTQTISAAFGRERGIEANQNLFDFLRAYHEATLSQSSEPAWSDATLRLFQRLELAHGKR